MESKNEWIFKDAKQEIATKFNRKIVKDNVYECFEDCIGNTPLLKLKRASQITGCNIYGKCDFMNPGGSVKDRTALYLVKDAEERGILVPGKPGYIIEGSTGNTGIGLGLVAANRGYKAIILIPDTQSQEKKDLIRFTGAHLVDMKVVPYKNPNHYQRVGERIAQKLPNSYFANQYDAKANRKAHYETTGPEIWAQLDGKIDGFCSAIGTGGTIAGMAQYLKEKNPNVKISISDPEESKLVNLFNTGELVGKGSSITEGIGQARVTGNIDDIKHLIDYAHYVSDHEAFETLHDLIQYEGLCMGLSTGINVAGTVKLAKELGPGHTIVTILCDFGSKYPNKIYNTELLKGKGLPYPKWLSEETPEELKKAIDESMLSQEEVDKQMATFTQQYNWPEEKKQ